MTCSFSWRKQILTQLVAAALVVSVNFGIILRPTGDLLLVTQDGSQYDWVELKAQQQQEPLQSTAKKPEEETVVICAAMKNEVPFQIQEWADYNFGIGVHRIYIYDNSDNFSMKPWWENYRHKERVTLVHFPGEAAQDPINRACAQRAKTEQHTYILFIDVDEFLVLFRHATILEFAQIHAKHGHVAINWRIFGTSGHKTHLPLPVTLRFQCKLENNDKHRQTKRLARVKHRQMKSLARVEYLNISSIDSPHIMPSVNGTGTFSVDGTPVIRNRHYSHGDIAVIHHYYLKSQEEFILKRKRGNVHKGNTGERYGTDFARRIKEAEWGLHLENGDVFDNTAWEILKKNVPEYAMYDQQATNFSFPCKPHKNHRMH